MYPYMMIPVIPMIPTLNEKPPTLYAILNSICNFGKEDKTKIKNLAKSGRDKIFDFDYPLSNKISKEKFECMILNHFLQRRIGFETITAFKIQLNVKLNEIMPMYNLMFDAIDGWKLFENGEKIIRDLTDNRTTNATNESENESTTNTNSSSDRRNSDMPQSLIDNVKEGKYLTNYNYDTDEAISKDISSSSGTSSGTDNSIVHETIERTPADKLSILKEMQQNIKSIYSMIFDELECLFYGIE